jgi:hypothetical protein
MSRYGLKGKEREGGGVRLSAWGVMVDSICSQPTLSGGATGWANEMKGAGWMKRKRNSMCCRCWLWC